MSSKGSDAERELARILWNKGFVVMRSPASGSAREDPQPDLLFSDGSNIFGAECKRSSKGKVYINREEVAELEAFCERFGLGCEALYAVRFNYRPWYFLRLGDLEETEGLSFRVDEESVTERGTTVEGLMD
nr:uncharacterized protein MJ0497 [uncultured archaeon]